MKLTQEEAIRYVEMVGTKLYGGSTKIINLFFIRGSENLALVVLQCAKEDKSYDELYIVHKTEAGLIDGRRLFEAKKIIPGIAFKKHINIIHAKQNNDELLEIRIVFFTSKAKQENKINIELSCYLLLSDIFLKVKETKKIEEK